MGPDNRRIPLESKAMTQAPLVPNPTQPKRHVCWGVPNPKARARAPCVRMVCHHLGIVQAPRGRRGCGLPLGWSQAPSVPRGFSLIVITIF